MRELRGKGKKVGEDQSDSIEEVSLGKRGTRTGRIGLDVMFNRIISGSSFSAHPWLFSGLVSMTLGVGRIGDSEEGARPVRK